MTAVPGVPALDLAELLAMPAEQRLRREMALVDELVDVPYYVLTNASVIEPDEDPVEHFCRVGWQELRKPNRDFDVWWYWANHLDPADDSINPLVHYALVGRAQGLSIRPESTVARPASALPTDRPIRRACLFAGYDADGVVDPSVIDLITELDRHADVFYLSDGYLPRAELAKLDGITEGAWAVRHGSYDFGSYSRLARDLVGWDRLSQYDEVLFVNDSCFLVRPLDDVFAQMDVRECAWWGLQATKGIASTRGQRGNDFSDPISLDTVRASLLDGFEDDPVYDFLVGSYFLAFRQSVIGDPKFRKLITSVHAQRSKQLIIKKYEIGLTHLLIGRGFKFDTYIPALYPFHPVFTEWYFELLRQGFPLLKRYFIYRNHYDVPGLVCWKERVRAIVPTADVDQFEATLLRTAPDDELQRSFSITRADDGTAIVPEVVGGKSFRRLDRKTEKQHSCWVFAVDAASHQLPDNSRAIFEAVRHDPAITKVLLTRSRRLDLPGANVEVEPLLSVAGRDWLLRAGCVFVGSDVRRTLSAPVVGDSQAVVMVREGLQLERSGRAADAPAPPGGRPGPAAEVPLVHPVPGSSVAGLLVASDLDRVATLATHWPASFQAAWTTGIPAHDFLTSDPAALPSDFREQLAAIETERGGRRLLLFGPTRRTSRTDRAPYQFSETELAWLRAWCERHDAVLGLREAAGDLERSYSRQLEGFALDLSRSRFPSNHMVLRSCDALLTDYSGQALDAAAQGGTVVSFAHDLDTAQDRLLYDLEHFFPGPVCRDFAALEAALETVFERAPSPRERRVREMLLDRPGPGNVRRVLECLAAADLVPSDAKVVDR